jgi:hypothetical protein
LLQIGKLLFLEVAICPEVAKITLAFLHAQFRRAYTSEVAMYGISAQRGLSVRASWRL